MNTWLAQHAAALRDALSRLAGAPLAALANVVVIALALSLPLALYVLINNLQSLAGHFDPVPQISIFLDVNADAGAAGAIESRLKQHAGVANYRFVSREQALTDLAGRVQFGDLLAELPRNPLPDAFVVTPAHIAPAALEALRAEAAHWDGVALVQLDSAWAQRLDAGLRFARLSAWLLAGLLAAVVVAAIINTLRLQILTRREEIEIAQLIGATRAWLRRPLLYFGAAQGLLGGLLAWALATGAILLLDQALADLLRLYALEFRLAPPTVVEGICAAAAAALLGWLGAWLSALLHLR
ncbi:MAG: permease-like cell division protein FtsX [Pseudomonadota bacterium]